MDSRCKGGGADGPGFGLDLGESEGRLPFLAWPLVAVMLCTRVQGDWPREQGVGCCLPDSRLTMGWAQAGCCPRGPPGWAWTWQSLQRFLG